MTDIEHVSTLTCPLRGHRAFEETPVDACRSGAALSPSDADGRAGYHKRENIIIITQP